MCLNRGRLLEYYKIERELQRLKRDEIKNQKISEIKFLRYQPGHVYSKYPEIKLDNNKSYSLKTENPEDEKFIKTGNSISKKRESSKVVINNSQILTLQDLRPSKRFHRFLMLIVSLFPIYGCFFWKENNSQ